MDTPRGDRLVAFRPMPCSIRGHGILTVRLVPIVLQTQTSPHGLPSRMLRLLVRTRCGRGPLVSVWPRYTPKYSSYSPQVIGGDWHPWRSAVSCGSSGCAARATDVLDWDSCGPFADYEEDLTLGTLPPLPYTTRSPRASKIYSPGGQGRTTTHLCAIVSANGRREARKGFRHMWIARGT